MRRFARLAVTVGALALLAPAVAGCAAVATPGGASGDKRPVVLTTFTVLADIAQNVAGEHLRVESITKVGAEVHGYEPTPGDLRRAAEADLILDNGLGLEAWFSRFVDELDVPHVVVSDGIDTIAIADGDAAGAPNPHAWMSPVNVERYIDNMVAAFGELDPDNAAAFQTSGEAYKSEVRRVHDELVAGLAAVPAERRVLVTCEGAFSYLARDADLFEMYLWAVNAEQQATPKQLVAVIDYVEENEVPAVFCESTVSDSAMRQVAAATGAELAGPLYVDSLSEPDGPVPSYLQLIRHTATTIVDGLTGERP